MRGIARFVVMPAALGAAFAAGPARADDKPALSFETDIRPIVELYCGDCHNDRRTKGDLNLARFETQDQVIDALAVWERSAKRIESKEMPPRDKLLPSDEERALLVSWIRSLEVGEQDCDTIATEESVSWFPGYVMSRRLNRWEYENTVRDLLGVDLDLAAMFPADGAGGEGFDNNGSALFLSAIQIEKYLEAADLAVETAFAAPLAEPPAAHPAPKPAPRLKPGQVLLTGYTPEAPAAPVHPLITVTPGDTLSPSKAAAAVIEPYLAKAWRRPVTADEVARMVALFDEAQARGDGYGDALKLPFKAALVSPNFLFLAEPEPADHGVYALGDYPLAARLSYFLWASMPDDELFALAAEGKLQDGGVLAAQVDRMLADPKARALGEVFAMQWLGISQLGETVKPDANKFPEYDERLAADMRAEAAAFFHGIVRDNRSLLELIDADYTYANERLAALYGLEGVAGSDLARVPLADRNRGGVASMAAVLTATSHPLRTSPVLRGKWVLEQLLGDPVPPPPPDAGALPEDGHHPDGLSLRQQLELHRADPGCASCHSRMDPLGFGLENFDPIGRWRTEDSGAPIDAQGELPSGETFNGPQELKAILMARKTDFARHLSRKMLGYAIGRSLHRFDQCVVDDAVEALEANNYEAGHLFRTIALSYPFRHRYSGGEK